MDRRTQASWLPAPALMASIFPSGGTSWAHGGPLGASFPRADAGCPAPARCVWVTSVKCIVFRCRWGRCKGRACNMGEGGQCPSHPRPEPPPTCLDFDQDNNVARRGKVLKLRGLGWGGDWLCKGSTASSGGSISGGPPTQCEDSLCLWQAERHMKMWSQALRSEREPSPKVWPQLYGAPS